MRLSSTRIADRNRRIDHGEEHTITVATERSDILVSNHKSSPNYVNGQSHITTPTGHDTTKANSSQSNANDREMQKADTDRWLRDPMMSQSSNIDGTLRT